MSQEDYNPSNDEKTENGRASPPVGDEQAIHFLHALGYDIGNSNGLEIRLIGGQGGLRVEHKFDWDRIRRANEAGANMYFGVAHRDGNGGKAENVTHATAVWADIDGKDWDAEDPDRGKALALEHMNSTFYDGLEPSIIVDTGHGYHVYWLLSESYRFTSDEERRRFKRVLDGISSMLRGDKSANDIARILRLPGTLNTKYEEQRECMIIRWNPVLKYNFEILEKNFPKPAPEEPLQEQEHREKDFGRDLDIALQALPRLRPSRADDYESWLKVGMALHSISEDPDRSKILLLMWDDWSQRSKKFKADVCAEKWSSFSTNRDTQITVGSLAKWAAEDGGERIIIPGTRSPKPSAILKALSDMGYTFQWNFMEQRVYVNGTPMIDPIASKLITSLNEHKYRNNELARHVWTAEAWEHQFHPFLDTLNSFEWDGVDHITRLAAYFKGVDDTFEVYIRRWLVGAIEKPRHVRANVQNRTLVLPGAQDLGKSYFARWLASPFPNAFIESSIDPDSKDHKLRLTDKLIWEISEFGATTRRADREALKAFLTQEIITERAAYDRYAIERPAICSHIATINPEKGFFTDPTGSRRFMTCHLIDINWSYATEIDPVQLWAQAQALYNTGETGRLSGPEMEVAAEINKKYMIVTPVDEWLDEILERTEDGSGYVRVIEIVDHLKNTFHHRETDGKLSTDWGGQDSLDRKTVWFKV